MLMMIILNDAHKKHSANRIEKNKDMKEKAEIRLKDEKALKYGVITMLGKQICKEIVQQSTIRSVISLVEALNWLPEVRYYKHTDNHIYRDVSLLYTQVIPGF